MARGSRRRLTKSELKTVQAATIDVDGEPFTTLKGMRIIVNALIDNGDATLERCLTLMQSCNDQANKKTTVVPCSFCGKKLGLKQCSGCSRMDNVRYCSSECQKAAWPVHKTACRSRLNLDVE